MAAILCTVAGANLVPDEDGPHVTADGIVFFGTITVSGTYDQADRPKIIHANTNDLRKVCGINYVKAIEWLGMAASAVAGNTTDTGRYFGRWDVNSQRLLIFRAGQDGTAPVDQEEVGTGALFTVGNVLQFFCKITGN